MYIHPYRKYFGTGMLKKLLPIILRLIEFLEGFTLFHNCLILYVLTLYPMDNNVTVIILLPLCGEVLKIS